MTVHKSCSTVHKSCSARPPLRDLPPCTGASVHCRALRTHQTKPVGPRGSYPEAWSMLSGRAAGRPGADNLAPGARCLSGIGSSYAQDHARRRPEGRMKASHRGTVIVSSASASPAIHP